MDPLFRKGRTGLLRRLFFTVMMLLVLTGAYATDSEDMLLKLYVRDADQTNKPGATELYQYSYWGTRPSGTAGYSTAKNKNYKGIVVKASVKDFLKYPQYTNLVIKYEALITAQKYAGTGSYADARWWIQVGNNLQTVNYASRVVGFQNDDSRTWQSTSKSGTWDYNRYAKDSRNGWEPSEEVMLVIDVESASSVETRLDLHDNTYIKFEVESGTNYFYYEPNGGSGSEVTDSKGYYATKALKGRTFERPGYVQTSWNTRADGKGTEYKLGEEFSGKMGLKLYAQWTPVLKPVGELGITGDKWNEKIKLEWQHSSVSGQYSRGKWFVFRKSESETAYNNLATLSNGSSSYVDSGVDVGVSYSYAVTFVPDFVGSVDQPEPAVLTVTREETLKKDFKFSDIQTRNSKADNGIIISWSPEKSGVEVKLQRYNKTSKSWDNNVYEGTGTSYTDIEVATGSTYTYRLKTSLWSTEFYSDTFNITCAVMSEVTKVTASQGYYNNIVKVQWEADQFGTADTRYVLSRKLLTDPKAVYANIYEVKGTASNYHFDDTSAQPGQYYYYRVTAYAKDSTGTYVEGNFMETDGFNTSKGTMSGRVTFGSGTAVEDVYVRLTKNTDDDDPKPQFYALSSQDATGILTWTPTETTVKNYLEGNPMSVQMWVNASDSVPTSGERAFLNIKDQLTLYLKNATTAGRYEIVAKLPGKDKVNTGVTVKAKAYSNITLTADGKGKYVIWASDSISGNNQLALDSVSYTATAIAWKNGSKIRPMTVGGNGNPADVFIGNIDDVRVWSTVMTKANIRKNYNRMLAGTESNLLCYWTLDEGTSGIPFVYDCSKTNGISNGNHAKLSKSALFSSAVPPVDQLALYGMTDSQGNFTVRGVPFSGEGTSYTITPVKGVHEFNPAYVTRFVSNNSLTHNAVDFTDVSSFPVSGTVFFSGTTIPVAEAYIYVDGSIASKNGDLIQTDDKGEFSVDVPIGNHYIEIRKEGHTFENKGRYPADPNGVNTTFTFVQQVSGLTFSDETLVAVAGRVAGGDIENAKPLGFGESKANIGQATLTLDFVGSEKYKINATRVTSGLTTSYETNTAQRDFTATTENVNSVAYVEGGKNIITVQTDPKTGEFVAMLPPLKYNVTAAKIASQPEISFANNLPSIDASNTLKTYTDSIYNDMSEEYEHFIYAGSAKIRYKSAAKIAVTENADGSFGIDSVSVKNNVGTRDTIALYTVKPDQSIEYTFGYPVYNQLEKYTYKLKAYEEYVNKDNSEEPVTSVVPLEGCKVTIQNQFAAEAYVKTDGTFVQVEDATFELDSLGVGFYRFLAGSPNIQAPHTRGIAISFDVDGTAVQWEHNSDFKAIILGALPTGNNFVTYGPDKVLMILRDPPGTGSSTTYGKGYTHTEASSTTVRASENVGYDMTSKFGVSLATVTGNGIVGTFQQVESTFDLGFGISEQYDFEENNAVSHTVTVSEEYSTSDGSDFVGSVGDVFIGASTNVVLGTSNDVVIKKDASGDYVLDVKQNMIASQEFDTKFAYTENNIKNILIPNLIDARNNTLIYTTDPTKYPRPAQGEEPIYVTKLKEGDDGYGTPNNDAYWGADSVSWNKSNVTDNLFNKGRWGGPSYTIILPQNYQFQTDSVGNRVAFTDMIQWYNSSVKLWEQQLYNNEKAKVDAIIQRDKYFVKNYSFDAGSSITVAVDSVTSIEYTRSDGFDINVAFTEGWSTDVKTQTEVAYEFELHEEVTSGGTWEKSHGDEYETNISYTLAEDGDDDYLSVDVYNAPDGFGPIFVTRGGATCAPYEDEVVTEYYRPGTIISYKTLQIEKPELEIVDQVVTGVPAGKDAQVHIVLRNLSETGEDCYYGLWINPDSNPDGLQIYLEGQPIMSGVDILVPAGEPMYKTLLVRQTNPDVLDYENISLSFYSTSQPDDTGIFPGIYSDANFTVHFQPSVTDIDLDVSRSVVNTDNVNPLTLSVSGYDYNQSSFKRIRLQYKGLNDANFVTLKEYVKDPAEAAADANLGVFAALTGVDKLNLNVDLSSGEFLDQTYVFRAVAVGIRNGQEVLNSSKEIQVVRDMNRPQLIANPSPSNSILDASSEIMVTFNEDIRNNILTKPGNFVVTGVMNEAEVNHDVALALTGTAAVKTQATLDLAGQSFAADMWLNYTADGTIFQHGTSGNNFKVAIENGKLTISNGADKVVSSETLPKNKWLFLAFNFDNSTNQPVVNASYALDADIVTLLYQKNIHAYEGNGPVALGGNGLKAKIQELSFWDKARSITDALTDRSRTKNPYTSGLIGYWPFDEGHGTVAEDRSRSRHFTLPAENAWYLNAGTNYVVTLNGSTALYVPTSVSTRSDESYLVETWFRAEESTGKSSILSTPNGLDIALTDGNSIEVTFKQNTPTSVATTTNLKDGQWHHVALNVLRSTGGAATLYIDGQARRTFAASSVPTLVEGIFTLGGRYWGQGSDYKLEQFMKGSVDEFRVWKGRYTKDFIESRMYERVDTIQGHGNDGLAAYYPFETRALDSYGQVTTSSSVKDIVGVGLDVTNRIAGNGAVLSITFAENGPSLKTAPARENVQFDFVASERQIKINLLEEPYRIENCNVFITLKDVKDVNGNSSQPISWVVYVQQNQLKWSETDVELSVKNGETESFTVEISNEGATTDTWAISNLPSWLRVSAESGTLAPQATKKLTFTVEEGTAIGIYEAAIGLTGNQNIEAFLNVSLRVKGEAPDWTPVVGEEAMIVVGQLTVDGLVSCDTEDMVAAFDGLKCVGMAHPVYISRYDTYVLTMNIYGDGEAAEGKTLTYKAYDASTGIVYPYISSSKNEAFTFNACKVVGTFGDMAIFTPQNKIEQPVTLSHGGWKWFSLYVTTDDSNSVASVFSHTDKVSVVKNASLHADYYNGRWYGDLTNLELGQMYKLNATEAFDEVATGAPTSADSVQINLNGHGWTWFGYPLQYTNSLASAFADANPQNGDIIMSQSAFAMYMDGNWSGSLNVVTPGEGYKYYSNSDAKSFHFQKPTTSSSSNALSLRTTEIFELNYPENMAMVAVVKKGGEIVDAKNTTIAIYVGNELRGFSAGADAEGRHYVTVGGNTKDQQMKAIVNTGDGCYSVVNVETYAANRIVGSMANPFIINLDDVTAIEEIPENVESVELYDIHGRKCSVGEGVYLEKISYKDGKVVVRKKVE